jgi:menaquinone-specific isochorismate synthase
MTPLSAKFTKDISFDAIVKALHPTPALGALPRIPGQQWLQEQDVNLPRYRYGAPVAIQEANKKTTCAVAIRNVQWDNNWMGLGAGCGVVLGSQFENEWNELQLKIASIKKTLNL